MLRCLLTDGGVKIELTQSHWGFCKCLSRSRDNSFGNYIVLSRLRFVLAISHDFWSNRHGEEDREGNKTGDQEIAVFWALDLLTIFSSCM